MSSIRKQLLSRGLPPMGQYPSRPPAFGTKTGKRVKEYTSLPWTNYFDRSFTVDIEGAGKFNVYESGTQGPVVFLLHGGGFSGLTWALMSKHLTSNVMCRCVAMDLRGHGDTTTTNEGDLSADTLASDVVQVLSHVQEMYPDEKIVLVGHSMGGAIAVHSALHPTATQLSAIIVIDVVEGTAMDALQSMKIVLGNRPKTFPSIEKANEWCLRSGYIRNLESARVSMIGQLRRADNSSDMAVDPSMTCIAEEEETPTPPPPPAATNNKASTSGYVWRTNLLQSEQFWKGWFQGLSTKFLSVPAPKLLLLAGVDRLDRDLTIGQMQGKFQMQVLPKSGHAIHEDMYMQVADVISQFLIRHRVCSSVT